MPGDEIAGGIFVMTEVAVNFFIDVHEAGRNGGVIRNRESEAHSGAGSVIGVLAEDDNFYVI